MEDNRIGTFAKDGSIETYPEVSISGSRYDFPPTQLCHISSRRFVVLDVWAPKGFDVGAAVDALRKGKPAPPLAPPPTPPSPPTPPAKPEASV